MNPILKDLNPAQCEAVKYVDGPLLILAGAGSGKTRVITHRIAYFIKELGVDPWNILAMTFTNKAAQEMKERVARLLGMESRDVWISTFHSTCARILRHDITHIAYDRNFTIYDELDQLDLIKECLKELNIDPKQFKTPAFAAAINKAKEELIDYQSYQIYAGTEGDYYRNIVSKVYARYQQKLHQNNGLDFDDLIMKAVELFREKPKVLARYQERFIHLMVDEYQDTNHAQYVFTKLLAQKHKNICVVGDDDQSIYRWRGADLRNILEFEGDYKDTKVIVVSMMEDYRSSQPIIDTANNLIGFNQQRRAEKGKLFLPAGKDEGGRIPQLLEFSGEHEEAEYIAREIEHLRVQDGVPYNDIAVFYRLNAQSRVFEDALRSARIPYAVVGALAFYEHKEIKDIIAYLRVLVNPKDSLSLRRILNVPSRGIGNVTIQRLGEFARRSTISLWGALKQADRIGALSGRARDCVKGFVGLMEQFMELAQDLSCGQLVRELIDQIGYIDRLKEEDTFTSEMRIENLKEFMDSAVQFERGRADKSLRAFLEDISLISDIDRWDPEAECVTLMTLHNAKGLEFGTVFVTGLEEGIFPYQDAFMDPREMEEERRLCYVGITRAKGRLYLSRAEQRRLYGNTYWGGPSRFISEAKLNESEAVAFRPEQFKVGIQVVHPDWGKGKIIKASGLGEHRKVTVLFGDGTKKLLAVKYANLRRVL